MTKESQAARLAQQPESDRQDAKRVMDRVVMLGVEAWADWSAKANDIDEYQSDLYRCME